MGKVTFELELEGHGHGWGGHCGQRGERGRRHREGTQAVQSGRSTGGQAGKGGGCLGLGPLGETDDPGACFSGGRSLLTCAKSSSVTQNRVGLEKSREDPEGCS